MHPLLESFLSYNFPVLLWTVPCRRDISIYQFFTLVCYPSISYDVRYTWCFIYILYSPDLCWKKCISGKKQDIYVPEFHLKCQLNLWVLGVGMGAVCWWQPVELCLCYWCVQDFMAAEKIHKPTLLGPHFALLVRKCSKFVFFPSCIVGGWLQYGFNYQCLQSKGLAVWAYSSGKSTTWLVSVSSI